MESCSGNMMVLRPIRTSKQEEEEEETALLSPASRMFHEPNYNIHIVAIMGWKVPIEVDSVKAEIQRKLLKHLRFSSLQTVNDVILGITQAALFRYVQRGHVGGKRKFSLERMRCRATILINLRPALGVQAVAEMVEKNAIVIQGNCFGFIIIPLTIAQLENPLSYIHKANISMERKKRSLESQFTFYFLQLFLKFFGFKGATKLAQKVPSQTTLAFSNVAGPLEEVSCAGHPLAFLAPTCYGHPTGLMVHACSYAKKLTFAIAVGEGIIPDPDHLGDDFVDSFMLIKEAALAKLRTKVD
ncbi:wax ester synthase/diacylglycerol acyltransferase 6-like isoform X5 [Lycium ferocissimum]|uniref:wax ester synthase/diacylglycerol acyltransferase 6-like isoform X5 n=1 Tax=Lycium ferocissimum TaxID=112874 RepID=UPI002815726D|nr:wax ester synthase/diacylglycerol acyltransferase 6-like isoform X5 [Lycium ferocissimum]